MNAQNAQFMIHFQMSRNLFDYLNSSCSPLNFTLHSAHLKIKCFPFRHSLYFILIIQVISE